MMPANSEKQLSDEQSRSVAVRRARGAGAPAHLPPAPRRSGQDQHLDPGEGAGRTPAVHARHHDPAGRGARRRAAQGQRGHAEPRPAPRSRLAPGDLGFYSRPGGVLDRGRLPDAASVVRRQGRDLCLPHRDHLGRRHFEPDLPRIGAARCRLRPAGHGVGAEPVRLHLSRHQPAGAIPAGHHLAPDHLRRDVRHHDHAAGRPRRPAHAGGGADRLCAAERPVANAEFGRIAAGHPCYERYRKYLKRTVEEPFALFLPA